MERFLPPVGENTSCGAKKNDMTTPDFIDPRDLPAFPSLFRVELNGEIRADETGCAQAGVPAESVENTIAFLGLNVSRLRRAREKYLNELDIVANGNLDNPRAVATEARLMLLPNYDGQLPKFFTASRSYFGLLGENILAELPQAWI